MHVFGGLYKLPLSGRQLPVPWFCRAPLGLKSGTSVHFALVGNRDFKHSDHQVLSHHRSRLPDVIISTIDPRHWDQAVIIRASRTDGIGLMHEIYEDLKNIGDKPAINIALSESVTATNPYNNNEHELVSDNRFHEVIILCELLTEEAYGLLEKWADNWRTKYSKHHQSLTITRLTRPGQSIRHISSAIMRRGMIPLPIEWANIFHEYSMSISQPDLCSEYDLTTAVATADLFNRSIRITVPLKGVCRIFSRHEDKPNVLSNIVDSIVDNNHNIITHHLRKSNTDLAEFEAVCEPKNSLTRALMQSDFADLLRDESGFYKRINVRPPHNFQELLYPPVSTDQIRYSIRQRQQISIKQPFKPRQIATDEREILKMLLLAWASSCGKASYKNPEDLDMAIGLIRKASSVLKLDLLAEIDIYAQTQRSRSSPTLFLSTGFEQNNTPLFHGFVRYISDSLASMYGWTVFDADHADNDAETLAEIRGASYGIICSPPSGSIDHFRVRRAISLDYLFTQFNPAPLLWLSHSQHNPKTLPERTRTRRHRGKTSSTYDWIEHEKFVSESKHHLNPGSIFYELYTWFLEVNAED